MIRFFLYLLCVTPAQADRLAGVSVSQEWRSLLHFRKTSEADGMDFFLHPNGKWDAEAELREDARVFLEQKDLTHCKFPARAKLIDEAIYKPEGIVWNPAPCPEFTKWINQIDPVGVTLIFSAPYLGDPASMFGHTFLRISQGEARERAKNPLLFPTIGYEAITGPQNGLFYAIRGLIGSYPGKFTIVPFSLRVSLYTDTENRDLWEYELPFSKDETIRLLSHVWELSQTHFDYYFLDENCSYHLLSLLEVARPDWRLREKFHFGVIPFDTLRSIPEFRSIHRRPALMERIRSRLSHLNPEEREEFFSYRSGKEPLPHASAELLDALLDREKARALNESHSLFDPEAKVDPKLLRLRAKLPSGSEQEEKSVVDASDDANRPDHGHLSSRFLLYWGAERKESVFGFELRPALHDPLDPNEGFLAGSSLQLGRFSAEAVRHQDRFQFRLNEFWIAEVATFTPYDRLEKKLSWSLRGGFHRPKDTGCAGCVSFLGQGGLGLSTGWIYGMGTANVEAGGIAGGFRAGPGVEAGSLFSLPWSLQGWLKGAWWFPFPKRDEGIKEASLEFSRSFGGRYSRSYFVRTNGTLFSSRSDSWESRASLFAGLYF